MEKSCETPDKPKNFKEFIKSANFRKTAIAVTLGGVAGFLYYHFVGCASGSCGITSNPYTSILFGSLLGLFLVKSPCKTC